MGVRFMRKAALCVVAALGFCQPGWGQNATNLNQTTPLAAKSNAGPQTIALTRTAPAPYGAEGSVELQSSNSPAGNLLVVVVETHGLTPGNYKIEYVELPNGVWNELALMTVRDPDVIPDLEAGDSGHEVSTTHQSEGIKSRISFALPVDLAPRKISYIRLTELGGTVLLEGKGR